VRLLIAVKAYHFLGNLWLAIGDGGRQTGKFIIEVVERPLDRALLSSDCPHAWLCPSRAPRLSGQSQNQRRAPWPERRQADSEIVQLWEERYCMIQHHRI
jgi:hypothetical protein